MGTAIDYMKSQEKWEPLIEILLDLTIFQQETPEPLISKLNCNNTLIQFRTMNERKHIKLYSLVLLLAGIKSNIMNQLRH